MNYSLNDFRLYYYPDCSRSLKCTFLRTTIVSPAIRFCTKWPISGENQLGNPPAHPVSPQHRSHDVHPSRVLCFSRGGFMQPRLPVRWRWLGFSRRTCRSVVADLFLFSTEALLCRCQKRPVPCAALVWPPANSWGFSSLPGCPCRLVCDRNGRRWAWTHIIFLRRWSWFQLCPLTLFFLSGSHETEGKNVLSSR